MVPGFAKQSIVIGSAPHADIRLGGPSVLPEHAKVVHEGNGRLTFMNGSGQTTLNGSAMGPGATAPFDFRSQFVVGGVPVPLVHRALTLMLVDRGNLPATPGQLV